MVSSICSFGPLRNCSSNNSVSGSQAPASDIGSASQNLAGRRTPATPRWPAFDRRGGQDGPTQRLPELIPTTPEEDWRRRDEERGVSRQMDHEAAEAYPAALSPASCVRLQLYYNPSSFGIGPHVR